VLKWYKLDNLDGNLEPSWHLTYCLWSFWPTVELTIPYTYIAAVIHIVTKVLHNWDLRWQITGQAAHDPAGRPLDTPWWLGVAETWFSVQKRWRVLFSLFLCLPVCLCLQCLSKLSVMMVNHVPAVCASICTQADSARSSRSGWRHPTLMKYALCFGPTGSIVLPWCASK